MVYAKWRRSLPTWLDVKPVELPGRGGRMAEPLVVEIDSLAAQLAGELNPLADNKPYALFGHSLGALLAFEVAHALAGRGAAAPTALLVSGTDAPSRRNEARYADLQTDEALLAEMKRLNGTPPEVLDNPELMAMALPVLSADFRLCGSYRHRHRTPLDCPLHVIGGISDETTEETLMAWRQETTGAFSLTLLEGDHFFIHSQERHLLSLISQKTTSCC